MLSNLWMNTTHSVDKLHDNNQSIDCAIQSVNCTTHSVDKLHDNNQSIDCAIQSVDEHYRFCYTFSYNYSPQIHVHMLYNNLL